MIDLQGKVALVTGAAGGIGLGIAKVLAGAGARIAINDLDEAKLGEAVSSLGHGAIAAPGNVTTDAGAQAIVDRVVASTGAIDILVNNAGVPQPRVDLAGLTAEAWQAVVDVNLRGPFAMSRAVAPLMRERRAGAIVNVASIAGLGAIPASHAYGVSEAGVVMLTQTLATELARWGVRVNAVAPGVVDAPMLGRITIDPAELTALVARVPMGRLTQPRDIGNAVALLASDMTSYLTGVILPVDGGWSAFGGAGNASRPREVRTAQMEETPCS